MTDPTNPGDVPEPSGAPPPPPPPPAPGFPPPPGGFPPPPASGGFPPPTQTMPIAGGPLGPPPGPAAKSKGPLIAVIAAVAVLLGAVAFFAFGSDDGSKDVATSATSSSSTEEPGGPGAKEGSASEGQKDSERPDGTAASGDAQSYGDDPVLDALYDKCQAGDFQACDDLYMQSGFGTEYETFGDTCGDRNEPQGYCVDVYADGGETGSVDGTGAMSYGDDPQLDALYDKCQAGDFQACDDLYTRSDFGSEYETFGDTCGDRNEPQGYCVDVYADGG